MGFPCIDAGQGSEWMTNSVDIGGNTRIFGSSPDMGAYEFRGTVGAAAPRVFITLDRGNPLLYWDHLEVNTGYQVWRDTVPSVTPGAGDAQLLKTVQKEPWEYLDTNADEGNFYYTLVGENGASQSDPSNRVGVFRINLIPGQ